MSGADKLTQPAAGNDDPAVVKYIHWSKKPLLKVRTVKQRGDKLGWKPLGLWFSVGDGADSWKDFCQGNDFNLDSFEHATEITFRAAAKILRITNAKQLDAITEKHGSDCPYMPPHLSYGKGYSIAWNVIAEQFDAIVIAPYIWSRRLHNGSHWYYCWDCASGCVWNADAIAALLPIPPRIAASGDPAHASTSGASA